MIAMGRRKSIIHALNVFLSAPISIYIVRQTEKYVVGYEPKKYREHNLVYKFDKNLLNEPQFGIINNIKIHTNVDINVREDFRNTIKKSDQKWHIKSKNITVRFVSTRYNELSPLYGAIFNFEWRHTSKGGTDDIEFNIPECPTISNYNTIPGVCYKKISSQVSGSGTHALHSYLIISKQRGTYEIAKHIRISNETFHTYIHPISVSL